MSTVTDQQDFRIDIIDEQKYNTLSDEEKIVWEQCRNSFIEMMPKINGNYLRDAIQYSENFAYIQLNAINIVEKRLTERIEELERKVQTLETKVDQHQTSITSIRAGISAYGIPSV